MKFSAFSFYHDIRTFETFILFLWGPCLTERRERVYEINSNLRLERLLAVEHKRTCVCVCTHHRKRQEEGPLLFISASLAFFPISTSSISSYRQKVMPFPHTFTLLTKSRKYIRFLRPIVGLGLDILHRQNKLRWLGKVGRSLWLCVCLSERKVSAKMLWLLSTFFFCYNLLCLPHSRISKKKESGSFSFMPNTTPDYRVLRIDRR